jgi:hypothetical protein
VESRVAGSAVSTGTDVWRRARALSTAVALLVAVAAACGGSGSGARPSTSSTRRGGTPSSVGPVNTTGWVEHHDDHGFSVKTPKGWTVGVPDGTTAVIADAQHHATVVVRPFLASSSVTADKCVRDTPSSLGSLFPHATVGAVRRAGKAGHGATASLTFTGQGGTGRAGILCVVNGYSGMLYGIAAPQATASKLRPTMLSMLRTFHYASADTAASRYSTYSDPREGAFTLEVPRGWDTTGAAYRFAPTDVRPEVIVTSPDGTIRVRVGDQTVPTFVEPSQSLTFAGFPEGSSYSPGGQFTAIVRTYAPGAEFASQYATSAWASSCPGLKVVNTTDRPELAASMNQQLDAIASAGVRSHLDTGEASFTCTNAQHGYALAATLNVSSQSGTLWQMYALYTYLAPKSGVIEAQRVLNHIAATFQVDKAWAARQSNTAVQAAEINAKASREIADSINESYWYRQSVNDQLSNEWSNTTLGTQDEVNPDTGETYKVASGSNYYWQAPGGDVIGTDTSDPPGYDMQPLEGVALNGGS